MQEIAVLASRALTTQRMFTAVADNIANGTTAGYRKLEMDFKEVAGKGKGGAAGASYTQDRNISISPLSGVLQTTGNPFDVAITGEGYFAVDVNGAIQYTRRGQFMVNSEGVLVTPEGNRVLDNSNAPIQFPEGVKTVNIALDGTISTEEGQLAKIGVFRFSPEQESKLQRTGNTGFATIDGSAPTAIEYPTVRQGAFEGSNVNAVEEMVNMQTVSKAYENTISLLGSLNDLESRAIRNLGGQ